MPRTSQYEIPRYGSDSPTLLGWLLAAVQEGEAWLKTQKTSTTWPRLLELVGPIDQKDALDDQSNVRYPKSKRIARELVASLANLEPRESGGKR